LVSLQVDALAFHKRGISRKQGRELPKDLSLVGQRILLKRGENVSETENGHQGDRLPLLLLFQEVNFLWKIWNCRTSVMHFPLLCIASFVPPPGGGC
jgi:hypothetical protein